MFNYKVKTFQEFRYARRAAGAAPDQWEWLTADDPLVGRMITPPLDQQVNAWLERTGNLLIPPVASPSFYSCWVDTGMTVRCIQTALTILYRPGPNDDRPDPATTTPSAESGPAPVS